MTKLNKTMRDGKYYKNGKIKYETDSNGILRDTANNTSVNNKWLDKVFYVDGVAQIYKDEKGKFRNSTGSYKNELYTGQIGKKIYKDGKKVAIRNNDDDIFYTIDNKGEITQTAFSGKISDKLYYNGKELESFKGGKYVFPHLLQDNFEGDFVPGKTISYAGCGPTSMAMIIAGLKGDPTINPVNVVENMQKSFNDQSEYYLYGERNYKYCYI